MNCFLLQLDRDVNAALVNDAESLDRMGKGTQQGVD